MHEIPRIIDVCGIPGKAPFPSLPVSPCSIPHTQTSSHRAAGLCFGTPIDSPDHRQSLRRASGSMFTPSGLGASFTASTLLVVLINNHVHLASKAAHGYPLVRNTNRTWNDVGRSGFRLTSHDPSISLRKLTRVICRRKRMPPCVERVRSDIESILADFRALSRLPNLKLSSNRRVAPGNQLFQSFACDYLLRRPNSHFVPLAHCGQQ